MRSRGPLMTLLAGLALAGVLITLSMNATRNANLTAGAANAPAAPGDAAGRPADNGVETPGDQASGPPANDEAGQDGGGADGGAENGANGGAGSDAEDGDGDEQGGGAPAAPSGNQEVTWAGRVKGGKATVAITAKGGRAIAYVCDGERIEAWLQGTATGGQLKLSTAGRSTADASLTGTFGNGRAKGTVRVDGTAFTFDVGTASKPSGLYRATADVRGAKLVGGWIVLADGTQVGLATFAGSTVPVQPLDLPAGTVTVYGERITARPATPAVAS